MRTSRLAFAGTDRMTLSECAILVAIASTCILFLVWSVLYDTVPLAFDAGLLSGLSFRLREDRGAANDVKLELAQRVLDLEQRPVLSADAVLTTNLQACPSGTFERDEAFINKGKYAKSWERFDKDLVREIRQDMVDHMRNLTRQNIADLIYTRTTNAISRGIIMTAGNAMTLQWAKTSIQLLRETYGCKLPIELYFYKGELNVEQESKYLEKWKVQLREVDDSHGKGFAIKGYAFIQCSFQEFLYLDNDAVPITDPSDLFDSVEYTNKQGGQAIFYADSYKNHARNPIWRILGRTCQDTWSPETGTVLFNKAGNRGLNLAVLQLAYYMQLHRDTFGVLGYGDKDTWSYAAQALDLPLTMAPWIAAEVASYPPNQTQLCSHTILNVSRIKCMLKI